MATKKVSPSIEATIDESIQTRLKEMYRKRAVERIKSEMDMLSKKRGKPYRNIDLARDLGMPDGSLISKWFNEKKPAEIKDYHLQAMASLFHCTKSWLDGSGSARVHESYNSVIEKTGLSEEAIAALIDLHDNVAPTSSRYPDEITFDVIETYVDEDGNTTTTTHKETEPASYEPDPHFDAVANLVKVEGDLINEIITSIHYGQLFDSTYKQKWPVHIMVRNIWEAEYYTISSDLEKNAIKLSLSQALGSLVYDIIAGKKEEAVAYRESITSAPEKWLSAAEVKYLAEKSKNHDR